MKAIKKNFPAVISILTVVAICAIWVATAFAIKLTYPNIIASLILGVIAVAGVPLIKEKHIHSVALPLYICTVAIFVIHIIFNDYSNNEIYNFDRYLVLFNTIAIYTAALLPLTGILFAKQITKYKTMSITYLCGICAVALLPALLAYVLTNTIPVAVMLVVLYIVMLKTSFEKRIKIEPVLFIIPVLAAVIIFVVTYLNIDSSYFAERLDTIFTRGQNDPYGAGWIRTCIDTVLKSTPFIGTTTVDIIDVTSTPKLIHSFGNTGLVSVLAQYGWLMFIGLLVCYIIFFACIFRMVKKTNQSSFAKYTSFTLAVWLTAQAVLNIISTFLLDYSYIEMPFLTTNYTTNLVNFVIFAIIIALYTKRDCETKIEDYDFIEEEHFSIARAVKNLFNDDETQFDDIYTGDVSFDRAKKISNQLIKTAEKLYEENPEKYAIDLAESYYHSGVLCEENSEFWDEAETSFMKALEIYKKLYEQNPDDDNCIKLSYCNHSTGIFLTTSADYYRAEKYLLEAIKLKEESLKDFSLEDYEADEALADRLRNLACTYNDTAKCYKLQENYGNAEKYYYNAGMYYNIIKNAHPKMYTRHYAKNCIDIATLYEVQGKNESAADYYLNAADLLKSITADNPLSNCSDDIIRCYRAAANCYGNADKYILCLKNYKKALELQLAQYKK